MFSILFSPFGAAVVQTQEWMYQNLNPDYLQWAYHGSKVAVFTVGQLFS